ncbi:MAG: SURF1 family cytochrome oxidase biogenesis protein [Pseudomonadota bacterium]
MAFRPYPIMTVCALVGLAILLWLGNWQWSRYSEKIGRPPEVAAGAPDVLRLDLERIGTTLQHVYGIADGEPLWRRVVVAQRTDTQEPLLLVVDAIGGPNPVEAPLTEVAFSGGYDVRVFPRAASPAARNAPDQGLWYTWDHNALARALGAAETVQVAEPVTLTVLNASNPSQTRRTANPYGAPKPIDPLPPERHFGYALTWWGLGAALVGVYLAFHMANGRLRFRRPA